MPDAPDGYEYQTSSTITPVGDLGEVPARLGSPANYYRSGSVIFEDDCSHGFSPFILVNAGAPEVAEVVTEFSYCSGYSFHFKAQVGANTGPNLVRTFALPDVNKIGLFIPFIPRLIGGYYELFMLTGKYPPGYHGTLRLDLQNSVIQIRDHTNTFITVLPFAFNQLPTNGFTPCKLVIDTILGYYSWAALGTTIIDLSTYPLYQNPTSTQSFVYSGFDCTKGTVGNAEAITGAYVVTYGEP